MQPVVPLLRTNSRYTKKKYVMIFAAQRASHTTQFPIIKIHKKRILGKCFQIYEKNEQKKRYTKYQSMNLLQMLVWLRYH